MMWIGPLSLLRHLVVGFCVECAVSSQGSCHPKRKCGKYFSRGLGFRVGVRVCPLWGRIQYLWMLDVLKIPFLQKPSFRNCVLQPL